MVLIKLRLLKKWINEMLENSYIARKLSLLLILNVRESLI